MGFLLRFTGVLGLIGDSHSVGAFGVSLDQRLRSISGVEVETHAAAGAIAKWFIQGNHTVPMGDFESTLGGEVSFSNKRKTPKLTTLLKKVRPSLVVVELGANYEGHTFDYISNDVNRLIDLIYAVDSECFWVLPPSSRYENYEQVQVVTERLKDSIGSRCEIFESKKVTQYPKTGGDGVHYMTPKALPISDHWSKKVFETISRKLGDS